MFNSHLIQLDESEQLKVSAKYTQSSPRLSL